MWHQNHTMMFNDVVEPLQHDTMAWENKILLSPELILFYMAGEKNKNKLELSRAHTLHTLCTSEP